MVDRISTSFVHGVQCVLFVMLLASHGRAQVDSMALRYATLIDPAELMAHLQVLASDSLQGRDTGEPGQKMAAAYLRDQFISYGVPPVPVNDTTVVAQGYFQPFALVEQRNGSISLRSGGTTLSFLKELLYFNELIKEDRHYRELVHYGDGSGLSLDTRIKGKMVLIEDGGNESIMSLLGGLRTRSTIASKVGVEVLLVATSRMDELIAEMGHYVSGGRMRLDDGRNELPQQTGTQVILVDAAAMDGLLGRNGLAKLIRGGKVGRKMKVDITLVHFPQSRNVISENVLAYIEGTDKKDELIVLTAHYDHIGMEDGEIYNGADDDGSGTVALLGMCKAFAKARADGVGPRRSILVMPVSAEEKGLLGSKYYSEHPVFPLENTVANLNIDMIGRVDSTHQGMAPYIYVIGSDRLSSELHAINEEANRWYTQLELDYRFNAQDDPNRFYYRSDHYNFARKGVPAIFYFSGVHEDYHKPTDTVDKIDFDLLHQRTLLAFHTAWILANREERIGVDGKVE